MPRYTSNSLPKNTLQDEPSNASPEPKEKKKTKPAKTKQEENLNPQTSRMEKLSQVVGIFSLLTSFFLFIAIISFLINWFAGDADDIFSGVGFSRIFSDKTLEANNLGGRLRCCCIHFTCKTRFWNRNFIYSYLVVCTWSKVNT